MLYLLLRLWWSHRQRRPQPPLRQLTQGKDAHWLDVAEQRRQAEHSVSDASKRIVVCYKAIWHEDCHYPHLIHKRQLCCRWLCLNVTWFKSRKHHRQRQHKLSGHIRTCCNFLSPHDHTGRTSVNVTSPASSLSPHLLYILVNWLFIMAATGRDWGLAGCGNHRQLQTHTLVYLFFCFLPFPRIFAGFYGLWS